MWWQDRLTPVWKRISGGCHLNRPIGSLIEGAGFQLDRFETGYRHGPKPMTFMYQGSATREEGEHANGGDHGSAFSANAHGLRPINTAVPGARGGRKRNARPAGLCLSYLAGHGWGERNSNSDIRARAMYLKCR